MNSRKTSFLQSLRLLPDLTDEACAHSISQLISLAASEQSHAVTLRDVHEAVSRYECAEYLDPLNILPILLPCRHDGAMDLIRICAFTGSPKEVLIVVQEAIEYLRTLLDHKEDEGDEGGTNLVQRAIGIVLLCSPAISRSRLGKRSALELCSPVLENVACLITSVSPFATREQGRVLIIEVARLATSLSVWALTVTDVDGLGDIKSLLRELLDTTVVSYSASIQASLAVRAAERHFPRSFVKYSTKEGWQGGEGAMLQVQLGLESLGSLPQKTTFWKPRSLSDLVYLAHSTPPVALSPSSPSDLHDLVVNALRMNMVVDESLFLLLRILTHENVKISPDIAASLCVVLTAVASTDLDPNIRQLSLRLLSLTLSKLPPYPRLEMLLKLTTNEEFPQIRGPAVGLVKEAVLEALEYPPDHASRNPFGSAELLRIFGGVLFRPNPPEFFRERRTREELAQSLELLRIADCLSFYYILLQRDRQNRTGIRSQGNVTSVRSSILQPLRRFLDENNGGEERPLMALLSLEVGLGRINDGLRMLDLDKDT